MAQLVKNLPAMWDTLVQSLGWEDPLEERKATHSSILVWRIPWTSPWGCKESNKTDRLTSLERDKCFVVVVKNNEWAFYEYQRERLRDLK